MRPTLARATQQPVPIREIWPISIIKEAFVKGDKSMVCLAGGRYSDMTDRKIGLMDGEVYPVQEARYEIIVTMPVKWKGQRRR